MSRMKELTAEFFEKLYEADLEPEVFELVEHYVGNIAQVAYCEGYNDKTN